MPRVGRSSKDCQSPTRQKKEPIIEAPVLALFCTILSVAEILPILDSESNMSYCKRVCNLYKLKYTDRVRQNFRGSCTKKNEEKLRKQLLPIIDQNTAQKITNYLESKKQQKQKVYG